MTHTTGGPAFPQSTTIGDVPETVWGMTLRDWFATHASEQDVERYREYTLGPDMYSDGYTYTREQAKYRYADAMIQARGTE